MFIKIGWYKIVFFAYPSDVSELVARDVILEVIFGTLPHVVPWDVLCR